MNSLFSATAGAVVRWHDLPGIGEAVVFVHGLGCASSCEYPRVAADPAFGGRRAILIDLPGSGFSDKPQHYRYRIGEQAQVVAEIVDYLQLKRCCLYGHSMGGSIAIEAAERLAGRVAALAVSEPNLHAGGGFYSRRIAADGEADFTARGYASLLAAEQSLWVASLQNTAPWALWRAAKSLLEGAAPDWLARLRALNCRKAYIVGEHSLPESGAAEAAAAGIAVHTVAAAGHSMSWENPGGLAAALAASFAPPA